MNVSKTVRSDNTQEIIHIDPLRSKQKEDVAAMRASLLSCTGSDPISTKQALQNITVMRVYHQLSRIVRYTEMMDKIESKLYESIDNHLENMNTSSPSTWLTLLGIQEKLQKSMIESHKLLQPYLDSDLFSSIVDVPSSTSPTDSFAAMIVNQESRDKLRNSAQLVLAALEQEGHVDE